MQREILISVATLVLATSQPAVADVAGELIGGYDDNPFKFSDALPIDGGAFLEAKLKYDYRTPTGVGFVAEGDLLRFETDVSDADKLTLSGAVDYKLKGHFGSKKANYVLRLKYTNQDKTYVSRTTGLPGTFGGTSTSDRYDTDTFDVRARADIKLDKRFRLRLSMDGRDKSYTDYTAAGLSNLDHVQWTASSELRFRPDERNQLTGGVAYRVREYDDREGRDLAGALAPGSELEYSYIELDAKWQHNLSNGQDLRASYTHKLREDNVFGYYDTTTNQFGLRYRRAPDDRQELVLKATYIDYTYDNTVSGAILENDDPIGSKDGYKFSASYGHALSPEKDPRWWVTAKVTHEDYDSVDAIYVYDKTVAQVAFEAHF